MGIYDSAIKRDAEQINNLLSGITPAPIDAPEGINEKYRIFLTSIKSKPFLLLAGLSGTGKSRIVRELARACWDINSDEYKSQKPKNYEMIQVKPNWHDSSELIGYVSRVSGEPIFVSGAFLKFIARAWEDENIPYFLCLDEMNLAPVEQYFAEYLSVIESRKLNSDGTITTDPILGKSPEDWYRILTSILTNNDEVRNRFLSDGICIPKNLIVVGTVNMDETTFSFSRKVLDRAMTIEMNEVDLFGGLTNKFEQIGKISSKELVGDFVEGVDVYSIYKDVCDVAINYLQNINKQLEGTPFKVAYRTRNEVLLYVVNNIPYKKDFKGIDLTQEFIIARALDEVTNMKILSRIEGDETKVKKELLVNLEDAIKQGLCSIFEDDTERSKFETEYMPISLAKLQEMKKRLESGYTSFWS
jgi:5-methylcytosine-specific restriction endonuclease McrBC GTP-binding regulatory subunit McrB